MNRITMDIVRILLLLVLVGMLLILHDPSNVVVIQALGIAVFLMGGTHLTRRILFHRIDLQVIALRAMDERSMPAAVVFASICMVLVAISYLAMSVLRP